MLNKCANEVCSAPFRWLREGKLFQVETEYFAGHSSSTTSLRRTRSCGESNTIGCVMRARPM